MTRVAVVTDTTAYLPTELARAMAITCVSLYVNFGAERTEREADIGDYGAFFETMRQAEQLPTTSQPSVGDFIAAYEPLLAAGNDVISIHISGGLSGTHESARQAAEPLAREGRGGERVRVVDSATGAGGLGMVVLAAAHCAARGEDLETVASAAEQARAGLKMYFAIDTLEFLRRSGRIGGASAWLGSALKIKPILTVESEMTPVERVRTSRRAFERMVAYASERHAAGADGWVVQHIQAADQARALAERCRAIFGCDPLYVSEIGAVLGAHTGPGLLGVGSIPAQFVQG
ncbi:MAG: DegV family protein [Thermoleophilaceae bacterium]